MGGNAGSDATSGVPGPALRLVIEAAGAAAARSFPLGASALVLGRGDGCDVVLDDTAVSRRHARIESSGGGWVITDLGSSTGTIVDGKRISGPVVLRAGAKLRIGRVKLGVEVAAAAAPKPAADVAPAPARVRRHAPVPAGQDPLVGRTLGDLRIRSLIGIGASGDVYLARQENLGRDVAVKVLAPDLAVLPDRVEAFLREARAVARLVHPCIVTVFDARRIDDTTFFVMELMDGGSVEQKLAAAPGGRLPWRDAFAMLRAAARGLAYLHEEGFVHRDIKPGNLLLKTTGEVKIADLGSALELRDAGTARSAGTPHYAPPEVIRGGPPTPAADLYSLGAAFHHILTGKTPFEGSDRNHLLRNVAAGHAPRVIERAADVPSWLANAVDRLMSARPEDRFASAAELVEALESTDVRRRARAMGIAAPTAASTARAAARERDNRLRIGIAAGSVVALGVLGWAVLGRSAPKAPPAAPVPSDVGGSGAEPEPAENGTPPEDPGTEDDPGGDESSADSGSPAARILRRADALLAADRALDAVEAVSKWARAPERRAVRDAETDAAVATCMQWIRDQAPRHRESIVRGIAADQSRLATAYAAGLRSPAGGPPREDLAAILTAKARAAALEKLAPTLRSAPMRTRAENLAAKLARVDVTWRRFVSVLASDTLVRTWDEIKGLPQTPDGGIAWISREVPPNAERITFERKVGAARERMTVRWTELGVGEIARRLVLPYADRADPAFRADLAEMFAEASCAEGAAGCLVDAGDRDTLGHTRDEVAALTDLFAIDRSAGLPSDRPTRLREWAHAHRLTDAFLFHTHEDAVHGDLSLADADLEAYLAPKDEAPPR